MLVPATGDAYPAWTFEHFKKVLLSAKPDEIIVLQFHGVPDEKHPWVNTPPAADFKLTPLRQRDLHRTKVAWTDQRSCAAGVSAVVTGGRPTILNSVLAFIPLSGNTPAAPTASMLDKAIKRAAGLS